MKSKLLMLVNLLILAVLALTGCQAGGSVAVASREVQEYWADTVALENATEADWRAMLSGNSERFQMIKNENPLIGICFGEAGDAVNNAVSGRYDQRDAEGRPTGNVDANLLLNALVVTEDTPEFEECQKLTTKIANDITAWRLANIDAWNKIWDDKENLDTAYYGELGRALANQLLAFAGSEFMKTDLATKFAPPRVWMPTFNLEAFVSDKDQCAAFEEDYPGQAKWSNSLGRCQLIGQAAYDLIFRGILAAEVLDSVDTGVDQMDPLK